MGFGDGGCHQKHLTDGRLMEPQAVNLRSRHLLKFTGGHPPNKKQPSRVVYTTKVVYSKLTVVVVVVNHNNQLLFHPYLDLVVMVDGGSALLYTLTLSGP